MLSSNEIPIFCAEMFSNNTMYHPRENVNGLSYLMNITSLQIQSPCSDMIRRYFCYQYYPVCNTNSQDVLQLCASNCERLKNDLTCFDLIGNVKRELQSVGRTFPDIKCLTAKIDKDIDQATMPCLDIANGKRIASPHDTIAVTLHLAY